MEIDNINNLYELADHLLANPTTDRNVIHDYLFRAYMMGIELREGADEEFSQQRATNFVKCGDCPQYQEWDNQGCCPIRSLLVDKDDEHCVITFDDKGNKYFEFVE